MGYTLGRAWIEYLRIGSVQMDDVFGLRLNVWTSIVVFVAALVFFLWSARLPGREDQVLRDDFLARRKPPRKPCAPRKGEAFLR